MSNKIPLSRFIKRSEIAAFIKLKRTVEKEKQEKVEESRYKDNLEDVQSFLAGFNPSK